MPLGPVVQHAGERPLAPLTLLVALGPDGRAAGALYEDEGDGFGYERGEYLLTTYEAVRDGGRVHVRVAGAEGRSARPRRTLEVRVLTPAGEAAGSGRDGARLTIALPPRS